MQDSIATARTIARKEAQRHRDRMLAAMPVTERRFDSAGIPTGVLEGGDGPPIILLHGAGEFAATWMRVIPDLTSTHHVVAPDLPGHGASSLPDEPLDADRMMSWLAGVIEATCSEPPVLIGHLLGGALAARYVCEMDVPRLRAKADSPPAPGRVSSDVGAARTASPERSPLARSDVGLVRTANPERSRRRAAGLVLVDTFGLAPLRPTRSTAPERRP